MSNSKLNSISVIAELERCGISFKWAGDEEIKVLCPFHDDATPSCSINTTKREFKCHAAGCGTKGDIVSFLARKLKVDRHTIIADLSTRYNLEEVKIVEAKVVEKFHARLFVAGALLKELTDRGLSHETIRRYRLGEDNGRIQIPVKNENGLYVNIRKYLPGAPGAEKMKNMRGRGAIRLYPIDQLKYPNIFLTGGEVKALAATQQLNQYDIGCLCATCGEDNWDIKLSKKFDGKNVYVCYDIDEAGIAGALKVARLIYRNAKNVYIVALPLSLDEYPHGDVNDFVAKGGLLHPLIKAAKEFTPESSDAASSESAEPAELVSLSEALNAGMTSKRIKFKGIVSAIDTTPYTIPKQVDVLCDKAQDQCGICPIFFTEDTRAIIPNESLHILSMVPSNKATHRESIQSALGIPLMCRSVNFKPLDYYHAEDVRVSPSLEVTNNDVDRGMQPAIVLGGTNGQLELNETFMLEGRMYPHPNTQQSTLLISKYKTSTDALSSYECKDTERLNIFSPREWSLPALKEKLNDIYSDLEANVTRIYQRRWMHFLYDLAYHSPLLIPFDGRVEKGWVEVLVVGDSGQGKSEAFLNMQRHYSLGVKVECKNASVAGLLGGLQQMGTRWFVTWGVIPTNDRRLVCLEELKGANPDIIAKLTDMRSSGIAEIPKIEKRRTHARTRLIAISNPRSDRPVKTYSFGIETIKELIGSLEDIRRFDCALVVSSEEIDSSIINKLQRSRPAVAHRFDSDLCRNLILWSWTRKPKDIEFTQEATNRVLEETTNLCDEFTDMIPLLDRGSSRLKLARLAASAAARTFSNGGNSGESLIVRECHVELIVDYIRRIYSTDTCGYLEFSKSVKSSHEIVDADFVLKTINNLPFPTDFAKSLLSTNLIEVQDLMDWTIYDRTEVQKLVSLLVRKHALRRAGRAYVKTPGFTDMLKASFEGKKFEDRPEHITEEF